MEKKGWYCSTSARRIQEATIAPLLGDRIATSGLQQPEVLVALLFLHSTLVRLLVHRHPHSKGWQDAFRLECDAFLCFCI